MCTCGLFGCCVNPRRLWGRRGFTRQPENSKRAHLSVPAHQTPPIFNEKTPRERRKNEISGGREKKARNFGAPTLRAPTKKKMVKCGLAKFGQQKLAKFGQIRLTKCGQLTLAKYGIGQIRFGQMRPRPHHHPPILLTQKPKNTVLRSPLPKTKTKTETYQQTPNTNPNKQNR